MTGLPRRERGAALEQVMAEHPRPPGLAELWQQAGGDGDRYRALLREHGHLIAPGEPGYTEAPRSLPCGWPPHADEASYCGRCDLFVGYGAAGIAIPPGEHAGDERWLSSHCWICGRSREEIAADDR